MGRVKVRVEITARNVVNTDEIRKELKEVSNRALYTRGKDWVTKNVYNYIINDYRPSIWDSDSVVLIENEDDLNDFIEKTPKWALPALERGEDLYYISPHPVEFWQRLDHIVDYLNTQDRDWSRISFPQMEKLVEQWDAELKKQKQGKANKDDFKHLVNSGPYQWVEIINAEGLKDEGAKMGHCVGGEAYCLSLQQGKIAIFSLRDKNFDNPHVTIQVDIRSKEIEQIQGKQNTVQLKYNRNVADFLNHQKFVKFRIDAEKIWDWHIMLYKRKFFPYKDLPSSLSLNYSYVDTRGKNLGGNLHPDVLEGRTIKFPAADEGLLDSSSLEKAKMIIIPTKGADIRINIEKGCNLLKALNNIQVERIGLLLENSAGRIKLPPDLTKFKTVFFGGSSTNWDIPDNLKYNIILVRDKSIREAFEKKGIKVDKP